MPGSRVLCIMRQQIPCSQDRFREDIEQSDDVICIWALLTPQHPGKRFGSTGGVVGLRLIFAKKTQVTINAVKTVFLSPEKSVRDKRGLRKR